MNIDKQILDFMKKSDYRPMKRHDLAKELNITDQIQKQLRRILLELENKGLVTCLRKNRWGLKENRSLIKGKINILPNGNSSYFFKNMKIKFLSQEKILDWRFR